MFAYPCPFCTQRLLASPERIGQRTICPKCLKPIVIARPDAPPPLSGELTVAELVGESKETIFVNDDHQPSDEADAMDLSLPADYLRDSQASLSEYSMLPPLSDASLLEPALAAVAEPALAAEAENTLGLLPMAYGGADTPLSTPTPAPTPAPPHLGGLGAGPAAYLPPSPTPGYARPGLATSSDSGHGNHAPTNYGPPTAPHFPSPQTSTNTRTPLPKDHGVVVFQATGAESADIAAELTTNLTMRMKPPPEPPSDLRLTTGLWLLLNATGLSLWLLSTMSPERGDDENFLLSCVKYIGALQLVISYIWVAYLCGRKDTSQGLAALVPPVWIYHLFNPVWQHGYRPLRFAVMGCVLLALAYASGELRPYVHRIMGPVPEAPAELPPSPLATPLARLKTAELEGSHRQLVEALGELSSDTLTFADAPAEKSLLLKELTRFRNHDNGEVRAAALTAKKKWAGLEVIKPEVIVVLTAKSASDLERIAALDIAREYKDRDVTRAVATRIGYRGYNDDSLRAADTLRAIGRPEAEDALLELFEDEDLLIRGMPSLLMDPKIGGEKSVQTLRKLAATTKSRLVRDQATTTADRISATLGIAKPAD